MNNLIKMRKELGLSGAEIAKEIGISKSFYSLIERKQRTLTYKLAVKIAKIMNKKPDDIFYEDFS